MIEEKGDDLFFHSLKVKNIIVYLRGNMNNSLLEIDSFKKLHQTLLSDVGIDLKVCPAGSFLMGNAKLKRFRRDYGSKYIKEKKKWYWHRKRKNFLHKVTLTKPFMIAKYPVTDAQYESIIGNGKIQFRGSLNPDEHSACPIVWKGWDQAVEFCEKLNVLYEDILPEGYEFNLPTDAQWEYASKAESGEYNEELSLKKAKLEQIEIERESLLKDEFILSPTGYYKPNSWDIYCMNDSVWEWCRDCGHRDFPKRHVIDPVDVSNDDSRVCRGGLSKNENGYLRRTEWVGECWFNIGFRIALVPKIVLKYAKGK